MQAVDQVADVVDDVAHVQVLPAAIAGKDNLLQVLRDLDDRLGARERAVPEVIDRTEIVVRGDNAVGQIGKLLFAPKIGGHRSAPWHSGNALGTERAPTPAGWISPGSSGHSAEDERDARPTPGRYSGNTREAAPGRALRSERANCAWREKSSENAGPYFRF
jgi:hypothetical protein